MKSVHKTAILEYSAGKMYALVEDIGKYPEFLPWCSRTLAAQENETVLATMYIDFHGLKYSFSTRNRNRPDESITLELVKGPFNHLDGKWTFTPLGEERSRVDLVMNYEFSNRLLEKLLAPVFDMVSITLVDSFRERAKAVYG